MSSRLIDFMRNVAAESYANETGEGVYILKVLNTAPLEVDFYGKGRLTEDFLLLTDNLSGESRLRVGDDVVALKSGMSNQLIVIGKLAY